MDNRQKCHLEEATDVLISVDNQSECHVRQSDRISGDLEETNPSVSHKDKPHKVNERKYVY